MIGNLFAILGLAFAGFLFWQHRKQAELAQYRAKQKCQQLNLQLLSIAFKGHRLKDKQGKWNWHSVYEFEFSSLGDDCYVGEILMKGHYLYDVSLPAHRVE